MSTRRHLLPALTLSAITGLALAFGGLANGTAAPASAPRAADRCHQPGPYQLPQGDEQVELDPATMSKQITHPYWPMKVGSRWHYREGSERISVKVLKRTRQVNGITARVVHDVAREDGTVVEDTFDWYAQDSGGSVWYLGENTKEYDGDAVSTAGSWEYGVDGAQAGVILPADPAPGCRYRQEYDAGNAEDNGAVLSLRETIKLPIGRYTDVLTTGDYSTLEPNVTEHKFYARGIGPVLEAGISPHPARAVLVSTNVD